jgi:hypothetical protein
LPSTIGSNSDAQSDLDATNTIVLKGKKCKASGRQRRARNAPPSADELQYAKRKLQTANSARTIGNSVRVPTLFALCQELEIPLERPKPGGFSSKATLLHALDEWVRASEQHWTRY